MSEKKQQRTKANQLRAQKRRQIISELRANYTMNSICEQVSQLLVSTTYTLSQDEKEVAVKVLTPTIFDELVEERKAQKLCSNLKCARPCKVQSGPYSLLKKAKNAQAFGFCDDLKCSEELNKIKSFVDDQDSLVVENHKLLDEAAACLTKYCDLLSDEDFVQKLEKTNLKKLLDSYDKLMSSVRVQIKENEEILPADEPPKPLTQQMWTIDTTVHQKVQSFAEEQQKARPNFPMVVKTNRVTGQQKSTEKESQRKESEYMKAAKQKAVHFEIESESSES